MNNLNLLEDLLRLLNEFKEPECAEDPFFHSGYYEAKINEDRLFVLKVRLEEEIEKIKHRRFEQSGMGV